MTCPRGVPGTIVSLVVLLIIEKHLAYSLHFFVTGTRLFGVDLEAKVLHQPKARLRPPRPVVLGAERPRSHGRITPAAKPQSRATIGSRVSGLALDGGGSEGNSLGSAGLFDQLVRGWFQCIGGTAWD